jgi:hypothetical protein
MENLFFYSRIWGEIWELNNAVVSLLVAAAGLLQARTRQIWRLRPAQLPFAKAPVDWSRLSGSPSSRAFFWVNGSMPGTMRLHTPRDLTEQHNAQVEAYSS